MTSMREMVQMTNRWMLLFVLFFGICWGSVNWKIQLKLMHFGMWCFCQSTSKLPARNHLKLCFSAG